jgi:ferredoxin-NADP reductase
VTAAALATVTPPGVAPTGVAQSTSVRPDLSAVVPRPKAEVVANASLVSRDLLTPALARLTLRPDLGGLSFVAGQYVQIRTMDARIPPRPYSIASAPGARDLELLVARVDGGSLSPRLFELPTGSRLFVGTPAGRFRLERDDPRDHLLVATGSGIAPLLSMATELGTRPRPPRTIALHGVRIEEELAGRAVLERFDGTWLRYRPSLSRPWDPACWGGLTGRVDGHLPDLLVSHGFAADRTVAYLCGNPTMVAACEARLLALGFPAASIHMEAFTTDATA